MDYQPTELGEVLRVKKIVTVHYFEYTKDFAFDGEAHDFWEFVYVDRGVIDIRADERLYRLKQGEMTFHKPGEFHALYADGMVAPNLVIVSFYCRSRAVRFFSDRIFKINGDQKEYLSTIVKEAGRAFDSPLSDPNLKLLSRRSGAVFGAEQMIKLSLEALLISLYRGNFIRPATERPLSVLTERLDNNTVGDLTEYMEENINQNFRFEDFAKIVNVSPTRLKTIFKNKTGMGVVQYFRKLKISRAKRFIRENDYNFTQIALLLGYESIHTFSRQFKAVEGMSPREYAKSVKLNLFD